MRKLLVALGACAVVGSGSTAHADGPERFSYDFDDEFVDTESCAPWGFDIHAVQREHGDVTIYLDADGNFVRGVNHITLEFTISANGLALTERDVFNVFFDEDGRREVGLWGHIQGPDGGMVLLGAGQLVFDADGDFLYERGPHPQFFGASFCDALVPTG